jgi:Ni/Fe-hydrogenase subunit HybB-like protein
MDVWPQFRSPLEWDIWAVLTYLTVSVVFWYIGLVPDLAAARDRARRRGWQIFFGVLSLGWRGSAMHWLRWHHAYRLLAALWWRPVRRSPWLLFAISTSVAVGMWLERYMILVTSLYRDFLVSSWGAYHATFWDWAIYAGTIGLFLVPFLLIIRLLPVISIFETKEVLHEEREKPAVTSTCHYLLATWFPGDHPQS